MRACGKNSFRSSVVSVLLLFLSFPSRGSEWRQLVMSPGSYDTEMVYDAARGEMVLLHYEGAATVDFSPFTWIWDGSNWTLRSRTGPPMLTNQAMAYDVARRQVVLLGGTDSQHPINDTWLWDGARWTKSAASGPSALLKPTMTYDRGRGQILLYGQSGGASSVSETWLWDGSRWTRAASSGPAPRQRALLAYDAAHDEVVLYGGSTIITEATWTWTWNGSKWTAKSNTGPPQTDYAQALAYDEARREVIMLTSVTSGGAICNLWAWDGQKWTKKPSVQTGPANVSAWWNSRMAYSGAGGHILFFGIRDYTSEAQTWMWDGSGWRLLWTTGPSRRTGSAMAFDSAHGVAVVFGGRTGVYPIDSVAHADTWIWDGRVWNAIPVIGPSGRYNHTMAYDQARNQVVLFGGQDLQNNVFRDTWLWDGVQWTKANDSGPQIIESPSYTMAYDETRGRVVLAAYDRSGGATWSWTGSAWEKIAPAVPPDSRHGSVVYDAARKELLSFPVGVQPFPTDPILVFNGSRWVTKPALGNSPYRPGAGLFYDEGQRKVVLYGGGQVEECPRSNTYNGRLCNDTWLWDGSRWTRDLAAGAPKRLYDGESVYDSKRKLGLYWGEGTWVYESVAPEPVIASVVNGASFLPGISDGSWITIRGSNLSQTTRSWRGEEIVDSQLPVIVDGVRVTIDGRLSAVLYVSPEQLNVQAPTTGKTGPLAVTVTNGYGASAPVNVDMSRNAPGLFVFGSAGAKYPAALIARSDGGVDYLGPVGLFGSAVTSRPAREGEIIQLYATGLGPTNPPVPSGQAFSGAAQTVDTVSVSIGGRPATVKFSGLISPGLYQVNVMVPAADPGDRALVFSINGVIAQQNLFVPVTR